MTSRFKHFFPLKAKAFRDYAVGFALWIPAVVFFVDNITSLHIVRGRSMGPTLSQDLIMVRRWGVVENLRRGQVVLYRSPLDPETVVIKRVVALEGDVVRTREPYPIEAITVPEGKVWVEGDEMFHSMDSNSYGPISKGLITARVTHVLFPFNRAGRMDEEFKGRRGALIHKAS